MVSTKDNLIEKSKSDYQTVVEFIERIVGFSALFSAILYFLGWTKDTAYYLHFGLSLDLINKSSVELISSAWLEIVIGIMLFLIGYYIQIFINYIGEKINPENLKKYLSLFYILLITSIVGGGFYALRTTIYRSFVLFERMRDIGFMLLFVLFFWIATTVGKKLSVVLVGGSNQKRNSFFKIVFPTYYLFLIISILGIAFVLSRFSAARGLYYGLRDTQNPSDNLPAIVLVSNSQLPVNGELDTRSGLYFYDNLFYIYSNNEYIFAYGDAPDFDTTKLFRTYVIPKSDDVQMLFKK